MDFQDLFEITVKYKHRRPTSHVGFECGLCGRLVRYTRDEDEIRINIVSEEILYEDHKGGEKTIHLLKRSDWVEDYADLGWFEYVGRTCAKKIPKEYKGGWE